MHRWRQFYTMLGTVLASTLINIRCCSGRCDSNNILRGKEGTFHSPDFPTSYPDEVDCVYRIVVPRGYRVKLAITLLDVEYCQQCSCDFLEIRDGPKSISPLLGRFCDSKAVTTFHSSKRHFWVRFKSDMGAKYQGFSAVYVAKRVIKVPDVIQLKKSKGIFTSPNFPRHYGTNQYRLWRLQVSSDSCIKLYFEHFELRTCSNSRSCECDFIRFGEGHNVSGAPYGRFCGQSVTPTFTSKGSKVWVEFVSDSNLTSIGFQAIYQETTCASPSNTSQNSDKLQLLMGILCSLLVVIFMALLCFIPRVITRRRHQHSRHRDTCTRHNHENIKDCKSENQNKHRQLHQHHHHHHHHYRHQPHDHSVVVKKNHSAKQEQTMNVSNERRNVHGTSRCHCQCETPPLVKRDGRCDGLSSSSQPISQCSLISSSSST